MSILNSLTEKPWQEPPVGELHVPEADRVKVRKTGFRVLLTVVSVLFFLFLVAFLMRSQYPDWQPLAEQPSHPLFHRDMLWLNTLYLLLASVFIQIARMSNNKPRLASGSLLLGGVFAIAFITGQLLFWQQLQLQGFTVDLNPALSFFYLFTGLHAAHLTIGIIGWLLAMTTTLRHHRKAAEYTDLCAMYWHFLLVLWGLLFALLISKPETYNAIVEFCGLGGGL